MRSRLGDVVKVRGDAGKPPAPFDSAQGRLARLRAGATFAGQES
jgi:hypothetical protein